MPPENAKAGREPSAPPPGSCLWFRLSPYEGVISPVYRRGTWTHALHRAHLADTRPVAGSTFRMALWMTTSFWRATTTFALQTGHRRDVVGSVLVAISVARENTHSRSRLSRAFEWLGLTRGALAARP